MVAWLDDALDEQRVVPGCGNYYEHLARYERARDRINGTVRLLDAGSGTGYGAALLAEAGHSVVGIDPSQTAIDYASAEYGDRASFLVADGRLLPLADASFDVVICFEVIEHLPREDHSALVAELTRVLKPGGRLFLSTPNRALELRNERMTGREHWEYHVGLLSSSELRRLLRTRLRKVVLYGQTPDLGLLHLALKTCDLFGLRLLLASSARQRVRGAIGSTGREWKFRFSRLIARSAVDLFAEAVK